MVSAGGVYAMFIRDHFPELYKKKKKSKVVSLHELIVKNINMQITTLVIFNQLGINNAFTGITTIFMCYIFYFTWPVSQYGYTPGYKLMKLRIGVAPVRWTG